VRVTDRERGMAAVALYAVCVGLSALGLAVPGWSTRDVPRLWLLLAGSAVGFGVIALRRRLSPLQAHLTVLLGSVTVGVGQVLNGGGAATATVGVLYMPIAVYVFSVFSLAGAVGHVALLSVVQVMALVRLEEAASAPAQVLLTVGTAACTGLFSSRLVGQVRRLANSDALTGLPNRRVADDALTWALARAERSGAALCVALLDLDDFKQLNDSKGHQAGDEALRSAAKEWSGQLRKGDLLARIGGDEFLVVLEHCDTDEACAITGRLARVVDGFLRCSIGLARWDRQESPQSLLARADRALYQAKQTGLGGVAVSAPGPAPA
jgi:diguanylate cyclase (GGDEF)-like protein